MRINNQLKEDLSRLARLGSNISESHSCLIFLPSEVVWTEPRKILREQISHSKTITLNNVVEPGHKQAKKQSVDLISFQSLTAEIHKECRIPVGNGLIGWVAQHHRPIHISPFELDSDSLGYYTNSIQLKCLVALPIPILDSESELSSTCGVIVCDSRKAYSFTKLQIKLLEDLATEISRFLFWALRENEHLSSDQSLETFKQRTEKLAQAIGGDSLDILRIRCENFAEIEFNLGLSVAIQRLDQFTRLALQALPPHFPLFRSPNGEIFISVDNMMTQFFQNKLRSLADRLSDSSMPCLMSMAIYPSRSSQTRSLDLDSIFRSNSMKPPFQYLNPNDYTKVSAGGTRA